MTSINNAITLINTIRKEANGNPIILKQLKQKEAELCKIIQTTPEEVIKLIKETCNKLGKMKEIDLEKLQGIQSQLSIIKIKMNSLDKEGKQEVEAEQVKILCVKVQDVYNTFIREAKTSIQNAANNFELIDKEIKRVDECVDYLKEQFNQFEQIEQQTITLVKNWSQYKKQFAPDNSTSETKTIDFDLRTYHHKGVLDFDEKEALIEELETTVNKEFTEVVDEINDLKTFQKEWKDKISDKAVQEKAEKISKQIEKMLKRQSKKQKEEYLSNLKVGFKKVDGEWFFDPTNTSKSNDEKHKGEAELSITYELKIKPNSSGLSKQLEYILHIKRNEFKTNKFDILAIALSALEPMNKIVKIAEDDNAKVKTSDVVDAAKAAGEAVSKNEETIPIKEATASIHITMTINSSNSPVGIKITKKETLSNLNFKKKHRYDSNLDEAISVFKTNLTDLK